MNDAVKELYDELREFEYAYDAYIKNCLTYIRYDRWDWVAKVSRDLESRNFEEKQDRITSILYDASELSDGNYRLVSYYSELFERLMRSSKISDFSDNTQFNVQRYIHNVRTLGQVTMALRSCKNALMPF